MPLSSQYSWASMFCAAVGTAAAEKTTEQAQSAYIICLVILCSFWNLGSGGVNTDAGTVVVVP
jgi:hypothetical protein